MPLIAERVQLARDGKHPGLITRMPSGWAVMGEVQFLPGYCLLLPDPVVPSLNDISEEDRAIYLADMGRLGDAILKVTGAVRINYEILGNLEPELHAHLFPRYADEPEELRTRPAWFYDWGNAPRFSPADHRHLMEKLRMVLWPDEP